MSGATPASDCLGMWGIRDPRERRPKRQVPRAFGAEPLASARGLCASSAFIYLRKAAPPALGNRISLSLAGRALFSPEKALKAFPAP